MPLALMQNEMELPGVIMAYPMQCDISNAPFISWPAPSSLVRHAIRWRVARLSPPFRSELKIDELRVVLVEDHEKR